MFSADDVGICLGTLITDNWNYDGAVIERSIQVSAAAGFRSVVLASRWAMEYGLEETHRLLDDHGMTVGVLDAAMSWAEGPAAALEEAEQHFEVAAALGVGMLQAVVLTPELNFPRAVEGFAALCDRALAYEVKVAIEFVPWFGIPDLATVWRIVQEAGASNGGICLDMLHWHRQPGGPSFDLLATIPGEHLPYVQVCDASPTAPDSADAYMRQALSGRPIPGEGVVDIPALMASVVGTGAVPYFAFEVFNSELQGAGDDVMARRLRACALGLFAE